MTRACCVLLILQITFTYYVDAYNNKCGNVHLTVSARDSYLEINWIAECPKPLHPDEIILSRKNMAGRDEDPEILLRVKPSEYPDGYLKTKVKFGHPFLPGGWDYNDEVGSKAPGPHCFPYWLASFNNSHIIDTRCLAIQPTWMADNKDLLADRYLDTLLLPGTHNSGAFLGEGTFQEQFILNQDRDIWTQLVFGIRYLDFRIGFYGSQGFFLNHDKFRIQEVRPLFQQIKKFLLASPKEMIILDFHRFPYPSKFSEDIHNQFVKIVHEDLGEFAATALSGIRTTKLHEFWTFNKSLIICYNNQPIVESKKNETWLWHPLRQYWGDARSLPDLKRHIRKVIDERGDLPKANPFWALMAELTPRPIDIFFGTYNLRKLAQETNKEITKWFRDEYGKESNIVATDYFLGNDIIDIAIDINTRGNRDKTIL